MVKNNNPPGSLSGMGLGLGSRLIPTLPVVPGSTPLFGGSGWDSASTNNIFLSQLFTNGPYLNARSGPLLNNNQFGQGTAQGSCVNPSFSATTGAYYWEILWQDVGGDPSAVGLGVANLGRGVLGPSLSIGQKTAIYSGLALNGTGGLIVRADGTVWIGGRLQISFIPPQDKGDVVGIVLFFVTTPVAQWLIWVTNVIANVGFTAAGLFQLPPQPLVPVIVYDSTTDPDVLTTANFGFGGQPSFVGPVAAPDFFASDGSGSVPVGMKYGWPTLL